MLNQSDYQSLPDSENVSSHVTVHRSTTKPYCGRLMIGILISLLATTALANMLMFFQNSDTLLEAGRKNGLVSAMNGVVATEHPICSEVGVQVLKEGGSAVDAAVAAGLCIGVTNMYSSGIGGGGFMVIRSKNGAAEYIDFREEAPARSSKDMFKSDPSKARTGGLAVGVPGELYGYWTAHQKYGKLPWARLVQPSIDLAKHGFLINTDLAQRIKIGEAMIMNSPPFRREFAPRGRILRVNEVLYRPTLARTLETIAQDGINSFYRGWIATSLVATVQRNGGIITLNDMAAYRPVQSRALEGTFRGRRVITTPPPTSGPVMLSILNILEGYDFSSASPRNYHTMMEAFKYGYAQRSYYGDPIDPIYRNISRIARTNILKSTANRIRQGINPGRTFEPDHYEAAYDVLTDHGTMHLSVLNAEGEAVSLTSTVNLLFGSKIMDSNTGIILNDQMDDFSIPGTSNAFNLASSPYNYIHPRKRPLSSSVPTIIESNGKVEAVAGASGGSMIITSTLQVLVGMLEWGMNPAEAVHMPRAHHQLLPNRAVLEYAFNRDTAKSLTSKGHVITWFAQNEHRTGVQAIKRLPNGVLQASSDFRKGGIAAGY
ncbi:hypothetical protein BDV3_005431 [Batrachochytrium dendrobatidis]|nr:gamma-glutamyltransferase [Batrachochytrium dendrobatidis JEL423]